MKKAITILAIIAIVAGAVFAGDPVHDGASAIKVTTSVSNVEPIFVLKSGNVTSDAHASDNAGVRTPVATDAATAAALDGDTSVVITTNDLLNGNQTVTFDVYQNNATKAIKKYQLTAKATDLELYQYKNSAGVTVPNSGNTAHPAAAGLKKFTVQQTTVNTFANGDLTAAQATYDGTATAKTVEYLGTNVAADTKVASFTCTWKQNADAVVGDYQGTVTLTVATV